ncbi:MAG: hypothetical protein ACYCOU_20110 [Sulfobacillus sp.]
MSAPSTNRTAGIRDDHTGISPNPNRDGYAALIIGGVGPEKEQGIELGLGCLGVGLWFRCEGALLWDAYGSLMRSVLMMVHRCSALRDVYVVAEDDPARLQASTPVAMGAGVPVDVMRAMDYLLRHVHGVDPAVWLGARPDPESAVRNSVRLLQGHPLMPKSIRVQGFLVGETGTRLLPLQV